MSDVAGPIGRDRPTMLCIPVRDEVARLPALLGGLAALDDAAALTVCLFFDRCRDGSQALVAGRAPALPFALRTADEAGDALPNAGRARGAAMRLGLNALGGSDGLLLTTDADSVPARDWLIASRAALARAEMVAGRIVRGGSRPSPMQDRVESYYDRLYALRRQIDPVAWEPVPAHHFTGGANLGFTAAAYRTLGGFAPLASGEDARIVDDAGRAGLRVRRDPASVVHTSDRRRGRVSGGLATALRLVDDDAAGVRVGHPADAAWQYRHQAEARAAFATLDGTATLERLAAALSLAAAHVADVARECPNAEAFAMRIVPAPPGPPRSVPLPVAEAALATLDQPASVVA